MIERAEYGADVCRELFDLLTNRMHPEVGFLPLDIEKAGRKIDECVKDGIVLNARNEAGALIGTLGVMVGEHVWYSSERIIGDLWFYVVPEARMERVGVDLLLALRRIADREKLKAVVGVLNANRRQHRNLTGLIAQIAGYRIIGHATRI